MNILNIEIKSPCPNPEEIEKILLEHQADYIGEDQQIDTYFDIPTGRLKLREGNIEKSLIYYNRIETKGLKKSKVILYKPKDNVQSLKQILTELHGIKVIVEKKRKIFFIDNVKFHIDRVSGLGDFVEIEAISNGDEWTEAELQEQCQHYIDLLGLHPSRFIDKSYSDLLLK